MAKKIEIYENTLLKLLVRRGIDIDRKNVVLSEGELGYTTDTKKLYIGDGQTLGGVLVGGNKGFSSTNDILTLVDVNEGDIVYSNNYKEDKAQTYLSNNQTNIDVSRPMSPIQNLNPITEFISPMNPMSLMISPMSPMSPYLVPTNTMTSLSKL